MRTNQTKKGIHFQRLFILIGLSVLISLTIGARLAYLQIYKHKYYLEIAQQEQLGFTTLPARRGEILTRDPSSKQTYKLATNITLDTIYADPTLIKNPLLVAETLAPLLIDLEEERKKDRKRMEEWKKESSKINKEQSDITAIPDLTKKGVGELRLLTDQELFEQFKQTLTEKMSQKVRSKILLEENLSQIAQEEIKSYGLGGIVIEESNLYAKPPEIVDKRAAAQRISEIINIPEKNLTRILEGYNRYVILKRKLNSEISKQIKTIIDKDKTGDFFGIRLREEYYRYYPEKQLAAQMIGFLDNNKNGQYGVEETFNTILEGKEGIFLSQRDGSGNLITVGDTTFTPPQDGSNLVLTIDRSVQLEVEKQIKKAYTEYNPDSIQVIIMDPWTGKIIAMVHEPTFDPNNYSKVYEKEEINLSAEEATMLEREEQVDITQFFLYRNRDTGEKIEIFIEEDKTCTVNPCKIIYKKYKNIVGPLVYRNHIISDPYEPGSVMKAMTMSAALNDRDVTPRTTHPYIDFLKVDCKKDGTCDHEIHNATDRYFRNETMTEVLIHSSNVGISFVAQKLGKQLLYDYFMRFGFGHRTDIELINEHGGQIRWPDTWSESDHLTAAFGQGVTVTALQMAVAVSAIANGGLIMQPHIVDSIEDQNGEIVTFEPKIIQRAISEETADTITSMMVSVVEQGSAKKASAPNHYIAGKTGTAVTYKNGKPLSGIGTTITSFIGFAPIDHPQFVMVVKIDRPRRPTEWAESTAAPLFGRIAEFLLQYYNVPPDR